MNAREVPRDIACCEGKKRACYALNDEEKYVIVPGSGWRVEVVVNGLAVDEMTAALEETRFHGIQTLSRRRPGTRLKKLDTGLRRHDKNHEEDK